MTALNIISGILLVVASLAIILVVLLTDTRNKGINSTFGGASETFFGKNSANTRDAKLDKLTKICVIIFYVVTIVVCVVAKLVG